MRKQILLKQIKVINAFNDPNKPISGNLAGVLITKEELPATLMQEIATESKLPEVVFAYPYEDSFYLRFFSPDQEIGLCGHATMAFASTQEVNQLHYKGGEIRVTRNDNKIGLLFKRPEVCLIDGADRFKTYFCKEQNKYIIITNDIESEVAKTPLERQKDIMGNAGLFIAEKVKDDTYKTRFFRNGKEDPVHGSGQLALMAVTGEQSFTAIAGSEQGGIIFVNRENDSEFSLSGYCQEIKKEKAQSKL